MTELVGTDSVTDIRLAGGLLVNAIEARQSRRRDITTDEMKAVLEERDASVAEVLNITTCNPFSKCNTRHGYWNFF